MLSSHGPPAAPVSDFGLGVGAKLTEWPSTTLNNRRCPMTHPNMNRLEITRVCRQHQHGLGTRTAPQSSLCRRHPHGDVLAVSPADGAVTAPLLRHARFMPIRPGRTDDARFAELRVVQRARVKVPRSGRERAPTAPTPYKRPHLPPSSPALGGNARVCQCQSPLPEERAISSAHAASKTDTQRPSNTTWSRLDHPSIAEFR